MLPRPTVIIGPSKKKEKKTYSKTTEEAPTTRQPPLAVAHKKLQTVKLDSTIIVKLVVCLGSPTFLHKSPHNKPTFPRKPPEPAAYDIALTGSYIYAD